MAKGGGSSVKEGKESISGEGERTWARVVHGLVRGSYWTSYKLPLEDLEQL